MTYYEENDYLNLITSLIYCFEGTLPFNPAFQDKVPHQQQESATVYVNLPRRRLSMGIGGHHFLAAATVLHRFYDSPTTGLVETSMQGYSSATYIATFANRKSVVLQFRPSDRAIDEECFKTAHMQIGDLAPLARLLTKHEDSLLVYELSRIAGFSFCELPKVPNFVRLLPTVAEGFGNLLGKCCMENSSCRTDKR